MMQIFPDRKSTRLNSSHGYISYAVFCLKKNKTKNPARPRNKHVKSGLVGPEAAAARLDDRAGAGVPGSNPLFFEKAAKGAADIFFLALEDAVAPDTERAAFT